MLKRLFATTVLVGVVCFITAVPSGAAFPGANGKLAFERANRYGDFHLYTSDATSGATPTLLKSAGALAFTPCWSADGKQIVYNDFRGARNSIGIYVTSGASADYPRPHYIYLPSINPNGTRIAFGKFDTGAIEVLNTNTLRVTKIGNGLGPVYSPDGSKIAYFTGNKFNSEIMVMNSDGSNVTQLTNDATSDRLPDWSPDGSQLVFESARDGNREIYAMNADGSDPVRLTTDPSADGAPVWSPDGTRIAFESRRSGRSHIFTMAANGTDVQQVTTGNENDYLPDWQPT